MKKSRRIQTFSMLVISMFAAPSLASAAGRCEAEFGRRETPRSSSAEAKPVARAPESRLTPDDVKILSTATATIYSTFDSFRFKNFVRKSAPELAFEMNWNRPFEKIVGDFFMRLSRRPDFDQVTRELAANYRLEFSGRDESSKLAIDALVNLRSRSITIKSESLEGTTIETQTPENREILNRVVAALTHSYSQHSDFELQRLFGMERKDVAKIDWNRSAHDNVVDVVNWMLSSPSFEAIANRMIEKYKVDRSGKYPAEAELLARFAAIRPRSGRIPVKNVAEIGTQTPRDQKIIAEATEVLMRSFDIDGLKSFVGYKVYDASGNGIRTLVNWSGSREAVTRDVIRVMLNHSSYSIFAAKLSEAYRAERSGRSEENKIAIDRLVQIRPRSGPPMKSSSPNRVVVLTRAEWDRVETSIATLATWGADGLQGRHGNRLEEMVVFSVPSLGFKIAFDGPTRKMATEIMERLLTSDNYVGEASAMAGYLRRSYPGNHDLMKVAETLESLRPRLR